MAFGSGRVISRATTGLFAHVVVALMLFALAACGVDKPPALTCDVQGIDVSRHQGKIDWTKVADSGVSFAWIKATEGGDYLDPEFRRNWLLSRAAGVRRGAYHFVYWCRKAEDQAAWFVANVPADPDALPPVLDVEWNPASRTCPKKVSRDDALVDMRLILDAMQRAYGVKPVIYAPADFFVDVLDGSLEDYPLWVRGVAGKPDEEYGARPWSIWQYADKGTVPGIKGDVDRNCYDARNTMWLKPL